ncbi:DsbA family oxidoreductase [Glaesserella sp.]|uniref:DsbA family oxidoreductase n=1 Tax=Glaesserella sp. TaxID=2094731 RepID=UPI0035A07705
MKKIKIEMYSDYACPFCYIGKSHLEQALAQFEHADKVEIVHKAYELYPQTGETVTSTTQGRIEWKYHKTPEQALEMIRHIENLAKRAGIAMNYENVQNTNTFKAHRLTKFAASKENEMYNRLMKAYFTDNLPLADRKTLLQCAEDVGLDLAETEAFLNSNDFADSVTADETQARHIGVRSVPFFVINGVEVAGSQPPARFLALLQQVYAANNM